jgi:hypothetical protein
MLKVIRLIVVFRNPTTTMSRLGGTPLDPIPNGPAARALAGNLNNLVADYWVLEGVFGTNDLFREKSRSYEFITRLDEAARAAITVAERFEGGDSGCTSEFVDLTAVFQNGRSELSKLRQVLEGPTWHHYTVPVHYEVIGNQPNPYQAPYAPVDRAALRSARAKQIADEDAELKRKAAAFRRSKKGKQPVGVPIITHWVPTINRTQTIAPSIDAPRPGPGFSPVYGTLSDAARLNKTPLETVSQEKDAIIAQRDATIAQRDAAIAQRDATIAQRDAAIAHKDMLIAKYSKYLGLHQTFLDQETGDLILGSIGSRGMFEES